MHPQTGI